MSVIEVIRKRRAYRKLRKSSLDIEQVRRLVEAARLAPSCMNKQPWRFVMVTDPDQLERLWAAYNQGNEWARKGSLVVAAFTAKTLDCVIGNREYALFDTGIATGFMILAATEMGLTAHPIAGYDPQKVADILAIPTEMQIITLIVIGEHDRVAAEGDERELTRPPRMPEAQISWIDRYTGN
jgi:nitroreductase